MATFQPKFAIYILHIMRVQVVTILLLVLVIGCHAARNLRQVQAECPDELKRPVLDYTKSASYKDALAKACAKRESCCFAAFGCNFLAHSVHQQCRLPPGTSQLQLQQQNDVMTFSVLLGGVRWQCQASESLSRCKGNVGQGVVLQHLKTAMRHVHASAGDNPDCYLDCACTAYGAPGIVLAAAWGRRNPAQFKQYAQACGTMLVFEANALLPDYFKKETNTKVCTNRVRELSKDEPQT